MHRHRYAELAGAGFTSDAFHITASAHGGEGTRPCATGFDARRRSAVATGAARAMRASLRDARMEPSRVSYVNAHATSTPLGDANEAAAIYSVFGPEVAGSARPLALAHTYKQ